MNILIGVCGIGFGHSTRQFELANYLIERGHKVTILSFDKGFEFFTSTPFQTYRIWVPIIKYKKGRIEIASLIRLNAKRFCRGMLLNRRVYKEIVNNFKPDVCISDYEPVTARIAYKLNRPLVIVDQQSKFWKFEFNDIDNFSCVEEKKRLDLFFPKYNKRFITSFYQLPTIDDKSIEVIPPIIRADIKQNAVVSCRDTPTHVVVYLSEYANTGISQTMDEVYRVFSQLPEVQFTVFTKALSNRELPFNVMEQPIDRKEFCCCLLESDAVITTAGHTLISEALHLQLPLYLIPLPTFDQNYCANFINENQLGYASLFITAQALKSFIDNLSSYKQNIIQSDKLVRSSDPVCTITSYLEAQHNDQNCNQC